MSVRAYRVLKPVVTASEPSFNASHNYDLLQALLGLESTFDGQTDYGGGTVEVLREELLEFLNINKDNLTLFGGILGYKNLMSDIASTDPEEYIEYILY